MKNIPNTKPYVSTASIWYIFHPDFSLFVDTCKQLVYNVFTKINTFIKRGEGIWEKIVSTLQVQNGT